MVDGKASKVPSTSTLVDPTSLNWARPVLTNARLAVEVFDATGHFSMWQSEVLDALFQQGLDIAIEESKLEQRYAFSKETSAYKLYVALEEKFRKKNCQNKLFMKKRLFRFTYVPGTIMNDHITSFNQLVTDLMNMDEVFKDQDLALILLGSLPEEYKLIETTLLNGKDDVSLSEVCDVLYSKELRRKDKQVSSSGDAEVLLVRGRSQKKGTDKRWRSKLKTKDNHYKGKVVAEANVTKCDDEELVGMAPMDNGPHQEWFSNFEEHEEVVYTTDETLLDTHGVSSYKLNLCENCINGKTTRVKFRIAIYKAQGILDYVHSDSMVYTLKTKDEVLGVFIKWKKMMETQTCRKIKHLRTNNDGEYKNDLFTKFCKNEDIVRHFTVRHAPQQNRVAERMNRTLLEKVRCMLSNVGLGKEFWAKALTYAYHLVNRLPSTAIDGKTPFEKWYGKPATDYDSLHVFGSAAYYHVKESKLDPREKKALFMGITFGIKGYRLWCPETKKTIFSRDVTFNESAMLKKVNAKQLDGTPKTVEFERIIVPADRETDDNSPMVEGDYEKEEVQAEEPRQKQHESIATSKPKRNTKRLARLNDTVACASSIAADDVPATYSEVKNQTWELTNLPEGNKAIGCKWVYAKKEGFPGQDDVRYKAILVAKAYAQKERIDYNEVFSPVLKHSSIRILLALVAQLDLELVQMNVKTAFLHGDLEEEIYMVQPEGFKVARKPHDICKLHKSLYGLKQSPRQYNMLIASQSLDEIKKLKIRLKSEFKMKDLGEAKMILGMEIVRDGKLRKLCLTQKQNPRRISSAMSPKNDADMAYIEKLPYANTVSSLMYAMICTRPDISHVVRIVSRYMHNPGKGHWQAVKWILRYIHNTIDVGLVFEHGSTQCVAGYSDFDYDGDLDKRRSTTGYVFALVKALISWKSTLQSTTALSTMEAEYMAMTEAVKEAIWLQGLLGELGISWFEDFTKMVVGDTKEWIFAKVEICKNNMAHMWITLQVAKVQ
nr:retrotransposon protein, putative, Ty1-copia subclass [Tanacetum cinerariifolium]